MKKISILFLFSILTALNLQAQDTYNTRYYTEPTRYVLVGGIAYELILDTQKGIIKYMRTKYTELAPEYVIFINDKDLTKGTPTKDGRFRLINNDWVKRLFDTYTGRTWNIKLDINADKCRFEYVENSEMPK